MLGERHGVLVESFEEGGRRRHQGPRTCDQFLRTLHQIREFQVPKDAAEPGDLNADPVERGFAVFAQLAQRDGWAPLDPILARDVFPEKHARSTQYDPHPVGDHETLLV